MSKQGPNIVLIQADQHRADCHSVGKSGPVSTPNLERLAGDGLFFSHAFTPIPLCTPSRTSLLTGLWPVQHGCIANHGAEAYRPARAELPLFTSTLRAAGYRLAHVGKWHVGLSGGPTAAGFDVDVPEKGYAEWRQSQGIPPRPAQNRWFGEVDPFIQPDQSRLAWGADRVIEQIEAASQHRPFFVQWDASEPHLPNVVPEPFASLVDPDSVPPWPSFADPLHGKPTIQRQQRRTWGVEGWTWRDWSPIVARYLGEIALLDRQIGRILDRLDRLDLANNTLVIYTADHGDLCGGHGMMDKHFVMYDDVVRVPLLMRWPQKIQPASVCDALVCAGIDLATTLCAAAGATPPSTFMGQDLIDLVTDPAAARQDVFASYHGNQLGLYSQRMVRDREWKYIWNATAEDELYNVARDPGEIVNLADSHEHAGELARLRQRVVAWMRATCDPLLNSWTLTQLESSN